MDIDTRQDLVDTVYRDLRRRIVTGALPPGTRLVERTLARELSVSRSPVREAIRVLSGEGLVVLNPAERYARPEVAPLSERDAADLHDVMAWIDAGCAEKAAALPDEARDALVREMEAYNEGFAEAARAADLDLALEQDDLFHSSYVRMVAGARVVAIRREGKPQLERYLRCYLPTLREGAESSFEEHQALISAIAAADGTRAHDAAMRNWRNAARRLRDAMHSAAPIDVDRRDRSPAAEASDRP